MTQYESTSLYNDVIKCFMCSRDADVIISDVDEKTLQLKSKVSKVALCNEHLREITSELTCN